jgi:hypothetical protein
VCNGSLHNYSAILLDRGTNGLFLSTADRYIDSENNGPGTGHRTLNHTTRIMKQCGGAAQPPLASPFFLSPPLGKHRRITPC